MATKTSEGPTTIGVGYLEIEPRAYRASLHGNVLPLSHSQLELLNVLVTNRNRVVSRAELAQAAGLGQTSTVDVVLSSLRRLLGESFVRNVRNRGWIFEPSVFER